MGDCIPLVGRVPCKWQIDTGAIAHETLLSYKHKPRCHVLACRLILSVSAAATPSGSKRWPGKPYQYHQHQKDPCRCPKDLIVRNDQPLIGYLLGDVGGSLFLTHPHLHQLLIGALSNRVVRRHRFGEMRVVQRFALCPQCRRDRGTDGACQRTRKVRKALCRRQSFWG